MRKMKITRFLSLLMAMLILVSTAVVAVSASEGSDTTDKSIEDYVDVLSAVTYKQYQAQYAELFQGHKNAATNVVEFDAKSGVAFVDTNGNKIEIADGSWKLTAKDGTEYTSLDAAVAAGFKKADLVYVEKFDGVEALYTPSFGSVTWTLDLSSKGITEMGLYNIVLEYYPVAGKSAAIERKFYLNGESPFAEARSLELAKIWSFFKPDEVSALTGVYVLSNKDSMSEILAEASSAGLSATAAEDNKSILFERPLVITEAISAFIEKYNLRFFITDADSNEIRPTQLQAPEWTTYALRDSSGIYAEDFGFAIAPDANGAITMTLDSVNEAVVISKITLVPYSTTPTYKDYLASIEAEVGTLAPGAGTIKLESEMPYHTSTNVVYPLEDRSSALTSPVDPKKTLLNTIGTEKWSTAGQWVEYRFQVGADGMYDIFARYKQSYLDGLYANRMLMIYTDYESREAYKAAFGTDAGYYDGVPFEEVSRLRFDYGDSWQVTGLNDGTAETDYQIYFKKGVTYTIRVEVTLGSMSDLVQRIEKVLTSLNTDYLSIIKLTGTSPDDYRNYNFARLLPETLLDMLRQADELEQISAFLKETAGVASTYSGTCDKLVNLLRKLARDEDEIAKNLKNFKAYVGNLGTFLTDSKTQPLQLDYLMIQPTNTEAPRAEANFFQSFLHEVKSFIQSFFRDYNSMGAMEESDTNKTIDVWLAYGRDQSQVIRNLSTNKFTPDTGISVNLKLVAGSTLLPSILAGMGPDVYLGLADATVINYAIRGALQNIEGKEGFQEMVDECFTYAAMIQLEIADADGDMHTYGLPETQTFQMMFVRLDILEQLDIEIPKTWDDIYTAQSKLKSNNMEIGLTTSYLIFLYQTGGDLYADHGMRINLDSTKGLAAFEKMCNLFTQHSFPYQYDAANRFRTGEMPIILAGYTGLYNQLKVFATEIDGKWAFVPCPGTIQEDGTINNTADSTITAVVMIKGIEDEDSAWKFMKWYTGDEAQSDYANEMVAIMGDSAKHPTANRVALETLPWTRDEYNEVVKQFENLAAIPNYPGSYYIGRHTEFAFLAALNKGADPVSEILSYINTLNKEITRKREEFNLETLEIGQTLAEKRMNQAMNAIENLTAKYANTKYDDAIQEAKLAVANRKVHLLDNTAALFEEILKAEWNGATMMITKVNGQEIEVPTYYKNVGKQTAETKDGGYRIDSLDEQQLLYFIGQCFRDAADALESYQ